MLKRSAERFFWETNRDKEEMDLICDWEIISSKAKCEAIEIKVIKKGNENENEQNV